MNKWMEKKLEEAYREIRRCVELEDPYLLGSILRRFMKGGVVDASEDDWDRLKTYLDNLMTHRFRDAGYDWQDEE